MFSVSLIQTLLKAATSTDCTMSSKAVMASSRKSVPICSRGWMEYRRGGHGVCLHALTHLVIFHHTCYLQLLDPVCQWNQLSYTHEKS